MRAAGVGVSLGARSLEVLTFGGSWKGQGCTCLPGPWLPGEGWGCQ